jgi:DNA repair protein RecN (Recombination protein N)
MLIELRIHQLGLVDELLLPVPSGLTVLTGETGAGKSMIAGAIALLTGDPVPKDLVRGGEDLAWVEGVFDLAERPATRDRLNRMGVHLAEDGMLVLRREIRRNGRNRVLINGLTSSLAMLAQVGPCLLSVQSQDQQRELGRPAFVRDLLDELAGCTDARTAMSSAYDTWRVAEQELAERHREADAYREQLDLWIYQRDELAAAALDVDEEPGLVEALALKRHAVELQESATVALQALVGGDADTRTFLGRALQALTRTEGKSARLDEGLALLRDADAAMSEAASAMERFLDAIDHDPGTLDDLEERKALYEELRRKYRRDVPDLLTYQSLLEDRIARQESAASDLEDLRTRRDEAQSVLTAAAAALRLLRHKGTGGVSRLAEELIRPLALPDLELQFSVSPRLDAESPHTIDGESCDIRGDGADEVDLLVRPNRGERAGLVTDIASGGEKSRIHLGLSAMRREQTEPPLQLFDEIDAGLGMDKARPVANLLRRLAADGQVICITHLAAMAVHGSAHWQAVKRIDGGRTLLHVSTLNGDERVDEVARLLGEGDATKLPGNDARLSYAQDLLREAGEDVAGSSRRDDHGNGS